MQSLQERLAPGSTCFGCGPANPKGLRIRSFAEGNALVAEWTPEAHHEAFPGVLNGGIIGALLDCHCNWAAAVHLMDAAGPGAALPSTVTADYAIRLRRPTPSGAPVRLRASVVSSEGPKAVVEGTLHSGDALCATCRGTFVAVGPDHPAFHRW